MPSKSSDRDYRLGLVITCTPVAFQGLLTLSVNLFMPSSGQQETPGSSPCTSCPPKTQDLMLERKQQQQFRAAVLFCTRATTEQQADTPQKDLQPPSEGTPP